MWVYETEPFGNKGLYGHGFLFDLQKDILTTIDYPTANSTLINGITESGILTGFASWKLNGCGCENAMLAT